MSYPVQPGMMPNVAPGMMQQQGPTLFGSTMQGLGFGGAPPGMSHTSMTLGQQQSQMLMGSAPINMAMNQALPTAVGAAGLAGMTIAPLMAQHGTSMGTRMAGYGLRAFDPFAWGAGSGFRAGMGFGRAALGIGSGGLGSAMSGAFAQGGLRAGAGMGLRIGAAGMMGVAGALPGIGLGLAATQGIIEGGRSVYQGAQRNMMGQSLMSQMAPMVNPGMSQRQVMAQGSGVGRAVQDLSTELGTSQEDIQSLVQQMGRQRMMQTTSSVKEFKEKFREVLGAVKEVAQATQSTLDETMQTFGELRQQGFYSTADIKAAAAKQHAREMATGISQGQLAAVGQVGAQQARARGMRGRYGAEAFQSSVASLSTGLRTGAISEEAVEEMGGVEAAGMRLAQKQMSFLGSSRGRAMMAYTMGEGGAPDMSRMSRVMEGGMSVESLVTGASGRGLGILQAAGDPKNREKYLPYAGMMMTQMAAAQQKQLYGGVSERGMINMMGTMGVGRDEARMMIGQAMTMPEHMRREAAAQETSQAQADFQSLRSDSSTMGRAKGYMRREFGMPLQDIGQRESLRFQRLGRSFQESMTGYREMETGGDEMLARDFYKGGGALQTNLELGGASGGLFGPPMGQERLRESLPASMLLHEGTIRDMIASGTVREEDYAFVGGGRAVRKKDLDTYSSASAAAPVKLTDKQRAALDKKIAQGDLRDRVKKITGSKDVKSRTGFLARFGGQADADDRDAATFALAKEAGILSDSATFDDYMSGRAGFDQAERIRLQKSLGEYMSRQEDERDRAILSPGEGGLTGLANIEKERTDSREGMKQFFRETQGGMFGISGEGKGLMEELDKSGEARQAFSSFMEVYTNPDATDMEKTAALNKAKEVLGEEGFAAVQDMAKKMDKGGWDGQAIKTHWTKKGGGRSVLQRRSAAEKSNEQMSRIEQNMQRALQKDPGMTSASPAMKKKMRALQDAVTGRDPAAVRDNMSAVFEEALSDANFSEDEETFLNQMLGGQQGSSVGKAVRNLTGTAEMRDEQLKALGITGKEAAKFSEQLSSKDAGTRATALTEVLKKGLGGKIDPGVLEPGKGATTVEGVQTKYVEANAAFVTAVHRFISAMGKAGVEGLPDVPNPDELGGTK